MTERNYKREAQELFDKHGYEAFKPYFETVTEWQLSFYLGWRTHQELKKIYLQWELYLMFKSLLKATVAIAVTPVTATVDLAGNLKDGILGDEPRGFQSTKAVTAIATANFVKAVEPEKEKQKP